jgi:hypothetical protein
MVPVISVPPVALVNLVNLVTLDHGLETIPG